MGRISVYNLEKQLYEAEVKAAIGQGEEREILYYVVTNCQRFEEGLARILEDKKQTAGAKRILEKREKKVKEALNRKEDNKKARIEQIGFDNRGGLIDIIEVPIIVPRFNEKTPFQEQQTPIILFRAYHKKGKPQEWEKTITGTDIEYIYQSRCSSPDGSPALTKLKDHFIEAREGSDLTTVKKLLDRKEVNLSLRRLREAAEYAIVTWIKTQLASQGKNFEEPEGRNYVDYAKEEGLMSRSDISQAKAFMYAGNAAVHHDVLAYHKLDAILFLHWLTDFIGRTLGFHRMPKSRENGTSFSDAYEYTTNKPIYRIMRAINDQLQFLKRGEIELPYERDVVYMENGERLKKEDVMMSSIKIVAKLGETSVRFHKGDIEFSKFINFCRNELRGGRPESLTPKDAIRAAMFAYSAFYKSKEIDTSHLGSGLLADELDVNFLLAVKRKGMTQLRYDLYKFRERLEPELQPQLELVSRVAHEYFPEYLPD